MVGVDQIMNHQHPNKSHNFDRDDFTVLRHEQEFIKQVMNGVISRQPHPFGINIKVDFGKVLHNLYLYYRDKGGLNRDFVDMLKREAGRIHN